MQAKGAATYPFGESVAMRATSDRRLCLLCYKFIFEDLLFRGEREELAA